MKINPNEQRIIRRAIEHWAEQGLVDAETAQRLRDAEGPVRKATFDWKNLSLIAFFFAVSCIILATVLLLLDDWLMATLNSLLNASDLVKMLLWAVITVGLYYGAHVHQKRYPARGFSNEALYMFGAIGVAFTLTYLSFVLGMAEGYFAALILLASGVYAAAAVQWHSKLTWLLALGTLAVWFGAETAYHSDWGAYFMGMNFPLRYVVFGGLLLGLSRGLLRLPRLRPFAPLTYVTGLLGLFFSLWLLSVFGNHGSYDSWEAAARISFLHWSLLLAVGSGLAIYYGQQREDRVTAEVGLAFLVINAYTLYFEFCWDSLHKVAFFAILAASFWLLGKKAERLWQLASRT
ncbi:MAG: hypothetical protein WA958_22355 [Tunicatimonas sp.]